MWKLGSFFFLLGWGLAACAAPGVGGGGAKEITPKGDSTQSASMAIPTETTAGLLYRQATRQPGTRTKIPTRTITPAFGEKNTQAAEKYTATFLPATQTPTPVDSKQPITSICSPLEFVALKDLPRVVSDKYNPPPIHSDDRHQGVDFAYYHWKDTGRIEGSAARSLFPGVVAASIRDSFPFGNLVIIETHGTDLPEVVQTEFGIQAGESLYVLYAHMDKNSPTVSLGEAVGGCQTVGYIGKTGNTEAAHLHLETRIGLSGARFEVFSAFKETATAEEKKNYRRWRVSGDFLHFDPMRLLQIPFPSDFSGTMGRSAHSDKVLESSVDNLPALN